MFRTRETRTGPGALFTPGTRRPLAIELSVAAACRLSTAGSCHPGTATQPGMSMSRGISKGFRIVAHSGPSPRLWPPWLERRPLGFPVSSAPSRQEPATHVTAGTGRTQTRSYVSGISQTPRLAHSPRATSCRNNQHGRTAP